MGSRPLGRPVFLILLHFPCSHFRIFPKFVAWINELDARLGSSVAVLGSSCRTGLKVSAMDATGKSDSYAMGGECVVTGKWRLCCGCVA